MSATYLSPSTIHYLHADKGSALSTTSDSDIMKISRNIVEQRDHPKLQVVEKDGHWFALNTSQLELCRRLERDGKCSSVRVDVVPLTEVPTELRKMMVVRVEEGATNKEDSTVPRSTARGYHKLTQGEKKGHDGSSGSDDDNDTASSSESEFDSDSECDWSEEIHGSSEVDSSDEDKSTDDERECLL